MMFSKTVNIDDIDDFDLGLEGCFIMSYFPRNT